MTKYGGKYLENQIRVITFVPMRSKDKWIQFRVEEAKRRQFARHAKKNKTTMSKMLLQFINKILS